MSKVFCWNLFLSDSFFSISLKNVKSKSIIARSTSLSLGRSVLFSRLALASLEKNVDLSFLS